MPSELSPRQTEGGKGDKDRSSRKAFSLGYDKIDWTKKDETKKPKGGS